MKLISVNVGMPKLFEYHGHTIESGIFKEPVSGPVRMRILNLDGDRQADLSVHGGRFKAVYAYPSEHYEFWRKELPGIALPWGMFGENLTTAGLWENDLHVGDRLQIGSAEVMVRQPRSPCYKLAAKFQRDDMLDLFLHSARSGVYFSVEREGTIEAGDAIHFVSRAPYAATIAEINRLYVEEKYNRALLEKAISSVALPESWREYLKKRLTDVPSAAQ